MPALNLSKTVLADYRVLSMALCRTLRFVALAAIVTGLASRSKAASDHPIIPGFERLYGNGQADVADSIQSGLVLIGELGCINCHAANEPARLNLLAKQAPILDAVGARVKPDYLRKFIADPHGVKPGTTMPNLFTGWNDAERDEVVEALTHFLASTGAVVDSQASARFVREGDRVYHRVGCVACHGSRREGSPELPTSVPLGDLSKKYTVASLAAFLQETHKVRPSGRMPWFHWENGNEPRFLAHYLAQDPNLTIDANTRFQYYEGTWQSLPDFKSLTPTATGKTIGFDLNVAGRHDNYAVVFEGTIELNGDADYHFRVLSDDGSRLWIDGKLIVDHDGIHGPSEKNDSARLGKGKHAIRVELFQGGGGAELHVDIEGAGLARQGLENMLLPLDASRIARSDLRKPFLPDATLVEKGRALFSTVGCANCHSMKHRNELLKPNELSLAPPLSAKAGGCIGEVAAKGRPQYAFSRVQRDALATAVKFLATATASPTPQQNIAHTLTTFNCIACHERNKQGGVEDDRNVFFETTTKEMGDEGRLPPTLSGVGAKLTREWLNNLWDSGAKVRPYMLTRMPRFGRGNIGHLTTVLEASDTLEPVPVTMGVAAGQAKRDGRFMVGAKAFGCIKCHTFNGAASTGLQALDLGLLTGRLKHDWFQRYMANPQVFRPGTRMPSAWPTTGKSYLPAILDGDVPKQIEAVWMYLLDRDKAPFPEGLGRDPIELIAEQEPVIYRNFIEGAGTRAIGVGYPEHVDLAFDANDMRLAMIWQGAFIDASRHWRDRGAGFQDPLGDNVWKFAEGPSFAVLASPEESWPAKRSKDLGYQWRGYQLTKTGRPVFLYDFSGVKIEDEPQPVAGATPSFQRVITLTPSKPVDGMYYRAAKSGKIELQPDGSFLVDGEKKLRLAGGEKPIVRGGNELVVPIKVGNGSIQIVQEYLW